MNKFSLPKKIFVILAAALLATGFSEREAVSQLLFQFTNSSPLQGVLDLVKGESFFPSPLRFGGAESGVILTRTGVIEATNEQRAKFNLLALRENAKLNQAAELKVKDMFEKQYFEHESPDGTGPGDLADQVGYKYLVVGENLAEGYFKSDADLVQAWMDSPGHRANILHDKFQEIGAAVGKGMFEGKTVWMAVQSFGTPASACPAPAAAVRTQINENKARIDLLELQARQAREDRQKYNAIVSELNKLIAATQILVKQYNSAVDSYNNCLEKNS